MAIRSTVIVHSMGQGREMHEQGLPQPPKITIGLQLCIRGAHMKELLDRLASYNLFNYLLPGVVFVVLAEQVTSYSFIQDDIVIGGFVYSFMGMVISRVGSLFLEPLFKKF